MKTNQIKPNLNEADIGAIADLMGNLLDKQTAVLATKQELKDGLNNLETSLKVYIHEGVETVMDGMTDLENRLDVRDRVDKLEKDVKQLKLNRV
jgi:uncharacterized phage infection (PIP) family protein YhgE